MSITDELSNNCSAHTGSNTGLRLRTIATRVYTTYQITYNELQSKRYQLCNLCDYVRFVKTKKQKSRISVGVIITTDHNRRWKVLLFVLDWNNYYCKRRNL